MQSAKRRPDLSTHAKQVITFRDILVNVPYLGLILEIILVVTLFDRDRDSTAVADER